MYVPLCLHIVFCYQTQTTFILEDSNKNMPLLFVSSCLSRSVAELLFGCITVPLRCYPSCLSVFLHPSHSRLLSSDTCCVKEAGTGTRSNPKTESLKTSWAPKTFFACSSPTGTWRDLVPQPAPISRCYFDRGWQNLPDLALFLFLQLQPFPSLS